MLNIEGFPYGFPRHLVGFDVDALSSIISCNNGRRYELCTVASQLVSCIEGTFPVRCQCSGVARPPERF